MSDCTPVVCSTILNCTDVLACVNTDLGNQLNEETFALDNFCPLAVECVDKQLENIANEDTTTLDFFGAAVVTILQSLNGYVTTGTRYLTVVNDDVKWTSLVPGATVVTGSNGILVVGTGPYDVQLIDSYVLGLFDAENGLTYNSGLTKWGGTLTENTTISGALNAYNVTFSSLNQLVSTSKSFLFTAASGTVNASVKADAAVEDIKFSAAKGAELYEVTLGTSINELQIKSSQKIVLEDGNVPSKTFFRIADYTNANNGDVLTLASNLTGEVEWTASNDPCCYDVENGAYLDVNTVKLGGILTEDTVIGAVEVEDNTLTINASEFSAYAVNGDLILNSTDAIRLGAQEVYISPGVSQDDTKTRIVALDAVTGQLFWRAASSITGNTLSDGDKGDITVSGSGATWTIDNNVVSNAKLRDSSGYSVVGKSTTGAGDPADIVAAADQVLRRSGSGDLEFGTLVTNHFGNDQVTFAKTQNISTSRILGRTTAGSGDIEQLTAGSHLLLNAGSLNTYGTTLISIDVFTVTGTWTKPAGCNAAYVVVVGGGGGGGGADASAAEAAVGSGGGAGAQITHWITAGLGATETVTVGAAGTGGDAGSAYVGGNGGLSTFGGRGNAAGGTGGGTLASGTTVTYIIGGTGGAPGGVITSLVSKGAGATGSSGIRFSGSSSNYGLGGSSIMGGRGDSSYGAGGDGNTAANGATADGNDAGGGIVIVYSYS